MGCISLHVKNKKVRLVPLGGWGNRQNMMVVEVGDDLAVVDAGVMFPEDDMLGSI